MVPSHRTLRTKLGIVACVFLAVMLVAVGLSALMIRSWDRALDRRSEARSLVGDITDLRLAYSDQETGIRGYRLSDFDESFLDPYRSGRSLADAMIRRIDQRSNTAEIDQDLAVVVAAADAWQRDVASVALDLETPLPPDDITKDRFDAVRGALDQLDAAANRQLAASVTQVERAQRSTFGVLVVTAFGAILGTALIMILFRRWILQPLNQIVAGSRGLAQDDSIQMPQFESVELQDVSDAIASLQLSLRRERDRALAAYNGLEQSARLALHIRSELAEELGELPGGWEVASALHPAEGIVAGDCYDLSLVDQHRFYVIMVDVTGHGAAAALHALNAKAQLRAALRSRMAPGPALEWLSRQRRSDERAEMLTAFVALINVETGQCDYANGGHPAPILIDGDRIETLEVTGPLIGAFAASWQTRTIEIPHDATLVIYTDGVTEALGPERARFGYERLVDTLRSTDCVEPTETVRAVVDDVDRFASGVSRVDDTTMVVLRRGASVEPPTSPLATVHT